MLVENATVLIFVGADNFTGEINRERLTKTLNERHDGYLITNGIGAYKGQTEPSVMITVSDPIGQIMGTIRILKDVLNQDSIGWVQLPEMAFA